MTNSVRGRLDEIISMHFPEDSKLSNRKSSALTAIEKVIDRERERDKLALAKVALSDYITREEAFDKAMVWRYGFFTEIEATFYNVVGEYKALRTALLGEVKEDGNE